MLVRWLAIAALVLTARSGGRAVAQNATRTEQVASAVRVEPSDDRCLSEAVVRARVLKRLARETSLSDVQVIVHVADTPRFEVLRAGQLVAERRFEHFPAGCKARRDAIAVAVALAIERVREAELVASTSTTSAGGSGSSESTAPAAAQPPADAPAPTERNAATTPREPSAPVEEASDDASSSSIVFGAHAGVAAVLEVLPAVAFAGVLGADVTLGPVRVSLSALASLEQRDDVLDAAIDSRLLLGRALASIDLTQLDNLALEGGAGVMAGAAFASGRGYASDRSTELGYAAALARVAVRFPASGIVAARLAVDGLVPLMRPSYVLREADTDATTSTTPAPIGAALSLEVALTLP